MHNHARVAHSQARSGVVGDALRATMSFAQHCLAFACGVMATVGAMHLTGGPTTALGRRKATSEKAFVLNVGLQFRSQAVADGFVKEWGKAAAYCLRNEAFLFAYEIAQSDQDPLKYLITERYRSKADYLGAHRSSSAFKEFRPGMKALQTSGEVVVTGSSYTELGVGFT